MKPETQEKLDYLLANCAGKMSQQDIADVVGVSKSTVCRRARDLKASPQGSSPPGRGPEPPASDREARLENLRDMLLDAMEETGGGSLANLSKEYRATIAELEQIRASAEAGAGDPISALVENYDAGL